MRELPLGDSRYPKARAAERVGTCNLGVGRHPVMGVRRALLRGEQWKNGSWVRHHI